MAIQVMQDVWTHAGKLQGTKLLLMLALADAADPVSRTCWPSVKRLSEQARCSTRQVQFMLRELEQRGYLATQTVAGRSNRYTLTPATAWEGGEVSFTPEAGCTPEVSRAGGRSGLQGGAKKLLHPNRKEPSEEPSSPRSPVDERVRVVQQHWTEAWQRKHGAAYPSDQYARIGRWVKRQAKAITAEQLCGWIDAYLADTDPWLVRQAHSWSAFEQRVPKLVAAGGEDAHDKAWRELMAERERRLHA